MKACNLESHRLYYKPLSKSHLSQSYVNWMNDDDVIRYLESGGDYTMQKLEAYIEEQEKKEILFWAIHLKSSNKHIGNIKIDPINTKTNSGEFGILIGDKLSWGKGFAKEASIEIIKYCFNEIKLSKITLGVIEDNIKALDLYGNLGFIIEDIDKEIGFYNNKLCNSIRMSLNVKDYQQ